MYWGVNGKELNTRCLGMFGVKKNASYQSSVRVISSVIVGIFLLSNRMTAAEAAERPAWRTLQIMVLPQIGRGRTFVRIAVVVSVRRVERNQQKERTHIAKHFVLKSSAESDSTMPDGIGGACLEEYSYKEDDIGVRNSHEEKLSAPSQSRPWLPLYAKDVLQPTSPGLHNQRSRCRPLHCNHAFPC